MSFEISYIVPTTEKNPDGKTIREAVLKLPNIEEVEPDSVPKDAEWRLDYLNHETGVSFKFVYRNPGHSPITLTSWGTGLTADVPTLCPTFVARECMPVICQLCKLLPHTNILTPNQDELEHADPSQLQVIWSKINRNTLLRLSDKDKNAPHFFPQEQLDEMWHFCNARQQMLKRYSAKGIYVPRVTLIRNKLDRQQVYRAAMWHELTPSVIPNVDALVVNKPESLLFGRFPRGEWIPTVVKYKAIAEIIEPYLRTTNNPFPHRVLENAGAIQVPVWRKLMDHLPLLYRNFETLTVDEIVDIQEV